MIAERIKSLHQQLDPLGVTLVAVSKFHPVEALMQAYDAGQRIFGESRVQELIAKIPLLPKDIQWHFIGHLQTNKIRQIIGHTSLIESVDSLRLLNLIDAESSRAGVITRILLQAHIAQEETKTGFSPDELLEYFDTKSYNSLKSTHICGLMGMATNTDDSIRINQDFAQLRRLFGDIRTSQGDELRGFDILSMGMSGDYVDALNHGTTSVRIGTTIFGSRQYKNE